MSPLKLMHPDEAIINPRGTGTNYPILLYRKINYEIIDDNTQLI